MNVYIDSLARTLAGRDIEVDVFTRRVDPDTPDETEVAPGYCVIQVDADGEDRADLVGSFAEGVAKWIVGRDAIPDILHSHYWLSGWAGVLLRMRCRFHSPSRSTPWGGSRRPPGLRGEPRVVDSHRSRSRGGGALAA